MKNMKISIPVAKTRNPIAMAARTLKSGFHEKPEKTQRFHANQHVKQMSTEQIRPLNISDENEWLCGETMPSEFCNPTFEEYIDDIRQSFECDELSVIPLHEDYAFSDNGYNVYLMHNDGNTWDIVGFYDGPTICVHGDHQGQGLGIELILHTALVREGPPTSSYDKQMFSEAGLAAHKKAWAIALSRGLVNTEDQFTMKGPER